MRWGLTRAHLDPLEVSCVHLGSLGLTAVFYQGSGIKDSFYGIRGLGFNDGRWFVCLRFVQEPLQASGFKGWFGI